MFFKFAKSEKTELNYLTVDAVKEILSIPDTNTTEGIRELAILSLMYDSGARVQEIADLKFGDIRLLNPATVKLTCKGRKSRVVPLLQGNVKILSSYIQCNHKKLCEKNDILFFNRSGNKLTRSGIGYILNKNVNMARLQKPELFPEKITPHCLRHFNASVLINNDVDVKTVQGCLGHSCASTTLNIYAHSFQDIEKLKSMAEGIEQQQTMILKQRELMEDIKNAINELINDKNHIDVYLKMLPHKWSFTVAKGVMVALETLKKAEASENSISEASLP